MKAFATLVIAFAALQMASPAQSPARPGTGVPASRARFNEDENSLLAAISDAYYVGQKYYDIGAARMPVFARFETHADPALQGMAKTALAFNEANGLAKTVPGKNAEALDEFGRKWKRFVKGTFMDELLKTAGVAPSNDSQGNLVRQAEAMAKAPQEAAVWSRRIECLRTNLRQSMHGQAADAAQTHNDGRPVVGGAVALRLAVKDGMIWAVVTNRAAQPLHHCLIQARRLQDVETIERETNRDRNLAGALNALIGLSPEANRLNDLQGTLLMETHKLQYGGMVYLNELQPGLPVSFHIAPTDHQQYTKSISLSFWSDECTQLNTAGNLAETRPASTPTPVPSRPNTFSSTKPGTNGRKDRFGFEGLKPGSLQPSKSLIK